MNNMFHNQIIWHMVIQMVLYLNPHLTINCSPLLNSLGDIHIFQILFKLKLPHMKISAEFESDLPHPKTSVKGNSLQWEFKFK